MPIRKLSLAMANTGSPTTLNLATFGVDFRGNGSIVPYRASSATPTFTRASTASTTDQDLIVRYVLSGEARMVGQRRVRNLVAASESISAWSLNAGATRQSSTQFTISGANSSIQMPAIVSLDTRGIFVVSVDLSVTSGSGVACSLQVGDNSDGSDQTTVALLLNTTPTRYTVTGNMSASATFSGNLTVLIGNLVANVTATINIGRIQVEYVTGQSNQNPAEYVPVGTGGPNFGNNVVLNPDFIGVGNVTSWTLGVGAVNNNGVNVADITSGGASNVCLYQGFTTVVGKSYRATMTRKATTTGSAIYMGTFGGGSDLGVTSFSSVVDSVASIVVIATTTSTFINLMSSGALDRASFDNITFQECLFSGANVDGVKYFATLNGNTVASNVVSESTGALISRSINLGYLPEPSAQNLCLQSADFATTWTTGAAGVTTNSTASPDGTVTADTITPTATAALHFVTQNFVKAASAITYTASLYAKPNGYNFVGLIVDDGASNGAKVCFNVSTGAISTAASANGVGTSVGTATITPSANGFYRITLSMTSNTATALRILVTSQDVTGDPYLSTFTANGTSGFFAWGAQLIASDVSGVFNSYIPTTTVAVTRAADSLTYSVTGWLNASAGTLYTNFLNPTAPPSTVIPASLNDATANNRVTIFANATLAGASVTVGGANQSVLNSNVISNGAAAKIVNVYQANDFTGYGNNTTLGTDVSGTIPAVTRLEVGSEVGATYLGNPIASVVYYPSRLPNATAQALTV